MIASIVSWIAGGGVAAIGDQLNRAYATKVAARNSAERVAAEQRIKQLELRQSVLIAEQGRWLTAWIRPALALPFVVYVWKLVIYDKVLGWGSTPDLSDNLWHLMWIIAGAYFLMRPLEKRRKR